MDDQQAITRLKHGDVNGLSTLVTRYQVQAVRTAYLITQDAALAQDVVQDAFLNVYRTIRQFDSQRPFLPWFTRIVINGALKAAQRTYRHSSLDNDDSESVLVEDTSPDDLVETAETEQAVWNALAMLSPPHRAIIVLRFYRELSEGEIAQYLDIPVGTVKSRLFTAKKRLRDLMSRSIEVE